MLGLKQSRYSLFFSFVIQNVLNSYFTVEVYKPRLDKDRINPLLLIHMFAPFYLYSLNL